MEIKSTGIKNRSTGGGNHSTTGSDESIKHDGDQEEHFTRAKISAANPGKVAVKPELDYAYKGAKGVTGGMAHLKANDAACETTANEDHNALKFAGHGR